MDDFLARIIVKMQEFFADSGLQIIAAIVILIVGFWLAGIMKRIVRRMLSRTEVDPILVSFTASLTRIAILVFFVIAALGKTGIQTTTFVAVLGAAGLAVALAFQGSLSNFASGVLIIVFKPFKIGDFITAGGVTGGVEAIGIFTTELKSPDNKKIIVPNAKVTGDSITNFSAKDQRRVDMVAGVSYGADLAKVRTVLEGILSEDERILKDPAPTIGVLELADSSVNFAVRPWVKTADYWDVFFDTTEKGKVELEKAGITIPFPQRDVHLLQEQKAA